MLLQNFSQNSDQETVHVNLDWTSYLDRRNSTLGPFGNKSWSIWRLVRSSERSVGLGPGCGPSRSWNGQEMVHFGSFFGPANGPTPSRVHLRPGSVMDRFGTVQERSEETVRIETRYYSYPLVWRGRIIMAESTIIVSGSREKINLSLSYLATWALNCFSTDRLSFQASSSTFESPFQVMILSPRFAILPPFCHSFVTVTCTLWYLAMANE